MSHNKETFETICRLDNDLMTNLRWEEAIGELFDSHRANYILEICRRASEGELELLIETGESILKTI